MGKLLGIVVVIIVIFGGYMMFRGGADDQTASDAQKGVEKEAAVKATSPVKEFTTTAFYDESGVWYSLKEMRAKKGDTVRIKATNTKGMHDFTLDEFGIKKELPSNQEVVIEFTADKTGEFTYYCSKPGHRAKGQFGKLIVE